MCQAVQQRVLSGACHQNGGNACRLDLLQCFPSTRHPFGFGVRVEFLALFSIDAFYQFGAGVLAKLALIDDVDGRGTGTPFVQIGFFATEVQSVAFHHFVPRVGMVGHGVEQYTVHVEQGGFQLQVGITVFL